MKKRTPAKREPLPEAMRDALLGRRLARVAKQVRTGKLVPPVLQVRLHEATATLIRDGIQDWLKSGDFGRLAALLEKVPQAIAHPAVVLALRRLAEVRRRPDPEEGGYSPDNEEDPLPDGARQAADDTLRAIAGAVVSGLLERTGWTVQPPPSKSGRPLGDRLASHSMLDAYEGVLAYLQPRKKELVRRRESRQQWVARIVDLIQQAWMDSWMSVGSPDPTPPLQTPSRHSDGTDIFSDPIRINHVPLPKATAEGFANDALARVSFPPSEIAFILVAHYFDVESDSVRHLIAPARK